MQNSFWNQGFPFSSSKSGFSFPVLCTALYFSLLQLHVLGQQCAQAGVRTVHVLEGMVFDASPLSAVGLIHFNVCWPWCNFASELQVTEYFPLVMHVQDIHTHIYICTHRDTPAQAVGCQSLIHLNVQASH